MPTITVLDDEYATLWYHPEGGIVHHKLHKYPMPGVFQRLLTASAELFETHHATKYLSDDQSNVVVDPRDIKWADANWYPRVIKAGLRHWALVVPSNLVGTMQSKTIVEERRKRGLDVQAFDSDVAAMAWLRSRS
jgi:hypothetical protein